MHRFFSTVFCVCISLLVTAQDLPVHPHVRTATLENGITYYIWPDGRGDRASLRLLVPVGSVLEAEHERGLAHLVEHLMFRGTESYGQCQIANFLESIDAAMGADANAFTSFDRTVYELEIPADHAGALFTALNLMRGWVSEALLEHRDIEAERSIVMEEWRLGVGRGQALYEKAFAAMLAGSQYAERLPIGLPEIIATASPQTIRNFWRHWYTAAPSAIVVTGPVDPDLVQELIEDTFGRLPGHRSWEAIPLYPAPRQEGLSIRVFSDPRWAETSMHLSVMRPSYPVQTIDDYRRTVIEELYTDLLHNRLQQVCKASTVQKAACYPVRMMRAVDVHFVIADCSADELAAAADAVVATVRDAQTYGFSREEFVWGIERHLSRLENQAQWAWGADSCDLADRCLAHFMDRAALLDPTTAHELASECLKTVRLDDLNAFAGSIALDAGSVLCITTNLPKVAIPTSLEDVLVRARIPDLPISEVPAFCGPLMTEPHQEGALRRTGYRDLLDMTSWELANGMRVHLLHRADSYMVACHGIAAGGIAELPSESWVAGRLANRMLQASGVGPYSPQELQECCGRGVELNRMLTPLSRHLRGLSSARDIEELVQMIHLTFACQEFDPAIFKWARADWLRDLAQEQIEPMAALSALSLASATQVHPLFVSPKPHEVRAVAFSDVAVAARTAFINPADFDLFFVGDLDPDEFEELIGLYLATLRATGPRYAPQNPLEILFPDQVVVDGLVLGSDPHSRVELTFPVILQAPTPEEFAAVQLAEAVVRKRLYSLLRGRLSATYHVETSLDFVYPDMRTGRLNITFSCNPEDVDVLALVALRELRRLAIAGPYEDEIHGALTQSLRYAQERAELPSFLSCECARYTELGWDLNGLVDPLSPLHTVELDTVHRALNQMLPLDRYALMMSFPE